ncbi:DUF4097 family beta strand repeat-containing protein [Actinomadura vinacea]|uniref:DUF4097 family beta strand repeat-containing protein n=1 Tax=Actinomadura vinacea TaxID=115336 RepID=A0ABP5X593_9ACTN
MITSYRRPLVRTAGALLALASLTACGASADDAAPEQRDFGPVGDRLTIVMDNGDLDVRPADVDRVRVTRRFTRWSVVGTKPAAKWTINGDRLTLATDCGGLIGGCEVRYRVLVPRKAALSIEGENGKISATGFGTALRIRGDNGAITVNGSTGPLDLGSENGELRATATRSARVSATSQSGKVTLSFDAVPQQVLTTTENGEVTVEVPRATYKVTTTTDSGEVRAGVPADPASPRTITARTENGSITLNTRR